MMFWLLPQCVTQDFTGNEAAIQVSIELRSHACTIGFGLIDYVISATVQMCERIIALNVSIYIRSVFLSLVAAADEFAMLLAGSDQLHLMLDEANIQCFYVAGTGQARGHSGGEAIGYSNKEQQQGYLHLALSIISAFCRFPELAAMDETISKVP